MILNPSVSLDWKHEENYLCVQNLFVGLFSCISLWFPTTRPKQLPFFDFSGMFLGGLGQVLEVVLSDFL